MSHDSPFNSLSWSCHNRTASSQPSVLLLPNNLTLITLRQNPPHSNCYQFPRQQRHLQHGPKLFIIFLPIPNNPKLKIIAPTRNRLDQEPPPGPANFSFQIRILCNHILEFIFQYLDMGIQLCELVSLASCCSHPTSCQSFPPAKT